jgi:hypothetical protein
VYENVTAFISPDDFVVPVVCEYRLRNLTDKTQTVEMSFLINSEASPSGADGEGPYVETYLWAHTNFVVLVNGREVSVETAPAKPGAWANYLQYPTDTLPVWTVTVKAREEAHISISYRSMKHGGSGVAVYRYLAKAAALWAGPIEYATIRFVLGEWVTWEVEESRSEYSIYRISPKDYQIKKAGLVWVRENWEPDEDFTFVVESKEKLTRP